MSFIIFDTEYTSWKGCLENGRADWQKEEIVQLAALKLNDETLEVETELNLYIKPKINPVLSDFFITLTGITNEKLAAEGIDFPEAYKKFKEFAESCICYSHGWSASCSDLADGEVMNLNLAYNNMTDLATPQYKNIVPWFKAQYAKFGIGITKQCSGDIAELLGISSELNSLGLDKHNAMYDVYSIRAGMKYLKARG